CCSIGLTSAGIAAFSEAAEQDLAPFAAFRQGAAARAAALRDRGASGPNHWVFGASTERALHAALLLAADRLPPLEAELDRHIACAGRFGIQLLYRQDCAELTGALAECEHFGFRDGISQPFVWPGDEPQAAPAAAPRDASVAVGEFVLGQLRAGETAPARLAPPSWMRNGSFQVIRRLNQDVLGWRRQIDRLWQESGATEALPAHLIAAKLIGRWPSGAPLALAPEWDDGSAVDRPFDFDGDRAGYVTPRFAHIRKMLPRVTGFPERDWRRIIRRGVPFGPPLVETENAEPDTTERGLFLNAYMADIEEQFEFLTRSWANDPDFPEADDGPDPVIGQADVPALLRRRGAEACPLRLSEHITTSGCAYLFVPSAAGLRWLSTAKSSGAG
ncbi:MAG: hypothetical protein WCC64_10415, partial [Aliidongia sp.]